MTHEEKIRDAKEFTSLLLSCELAVEFNKGKPNKAIKNALRSVKARVTSPNIKLLAQQGPQQPNTCLLYTSPSPRDRTRSRMPSSA